MIKIAIVEDDVVCLNELKSFFARYSVEMNCSISVDGFDTADTFLTKYENGIYQMVFMDIEMPGTDGMEAAKILRQKDGDVLLFFVTNLSQYAVESYEVQAFNFMVKPITYNNFYMKMDRAIQRIKNDAYTKVTVSVKKNDKFVDMIIPISDIRYVEVYNHSIIYHTTKGDFMAHGESMKTIAAKLESCGFFMCDQSYLINLKYITAVDKDDVYIDSDVIKISRRKRNEFLSAVTQYISYGRSTK